MEGITQPSMSATRNRHRGNGAGSVFKAGKRWRWQLTLGKHSDGRQHRMGGSCTTKREAELALAEALAAHQKGQLFAPHDWTLDALLEQWLTHKKLQVTPGTFEQYTYHLKHIPDALRKMKLQDLKRSHFRGLSEQLLAKGLGTNTRTKILGHLRSALDRAVEEELVLNNPCQGVRAEPRPPKQTRRKALELAEMQRFLAAAQEHPFYCLLYTQFSLGLRRGEALGLRWQDINFDSGEIRIVQQVKVENNKAVIGTLKTQHSCRKLYGGVDLLHLLRLRKGQQEAENHHLGLGTPTMDLVFTSAAGTVLHPRNVNRAIYALCDMAGIPRFSSHSARHTHITQRLRDGEKLEVVSAIAGHASPSITLDVYRSVFEDEKRASVFNLKDKLI